MRVNNWFGVMVVAMLLVLNSCQKKETEMTCTFPSDRLIELTSEGKTAGNYLLTTEIGHDGKDCDGCVMILGHLVHKDCMRHGRYCRVATSVHIDTIGVDITATTTDTFGLTSGHFFAIPDRSLNFTDENNNRMYLNIPEQVVYRDNSTQQFTFTGLFFSTTPAYTND